MRRVLALVGSGVLVATLIVAVWAVVTAGRDASVAERKVERDERELDDATPTPDVSRPEEDSLGSLLDDLFSERLGDAFAGSGIDDLFGGDTRELLGCMGLGDVSNAGLGDGREREPERDATGEVAAIARRVERIRKLRFTDPVEPTFVSSEEAARRVAKLFLRNYTTADAEKDRRVLAALGAVPANSDLRKLLKQALTRQVAGFYVPETDELVVRSSGGGRDLGPVEKTTLAHELEHALADQRLGLPVEEDRGPREEDAELAALAVTEGDATLTMQRYAVTSLSLAEQLSMLTDPSVAAARKAGLAGMPHYVRRQLLFPYLEGFGFVCDLYADGGWRAVNRAYANPPRTTAEILFPNRYDRRPAVAPRALGELERPWRHARAQSLGAADLQWLFEAPGGDRSRSLDDPLDRVSAWRGGRLDLWTRGRDTAVGIALRERKGTDELCRSVLDWYEAAFPDATTVHRRRAEVTATDGESGGAVISCARDDVRIGIGPGVGVARSLVD